MARPNNLTLCSFCGKSHSEVRKLIAGPGVYICDSCVLVCKSVLDKELAGGAKTAPGQLRMLTPEQIKSPETRALVSDMFFTMKKVGTPL